MSSADPFRLLRIMQSGGRFASEAQQAWHVEAGGVRQTKPHDNQTFRGNNHHALAEIAGAVERVLGHAGFNPLRALPVSAAIGPESGAVIGVQRRRGGIVHPSFRQNAPSVRYTIIQVKLAETRPVTRGSENVDGSDRSAC